MAKTSFGIRIPDELVSRVDLVVEESRYLNISRSEVIEVILLDYFNSNDGVENIRRLIIKKREGRL